MPFTNSSEHRISLLLMVQIPIYQFYSIILVTYSLCYKLPFSFKQSLYTSQLRLHLFRIYAQRKFQATVFLVDPCG